MRKCTQSGDKHVSMVPGRGWQYVAHAHTHTHRHTHLQNPGAHVAGEVYEARALGRLVPAVLTAYAYTRYCWPGARALPAAKLN